MRRYVGDRRLLGVLKHDLFRSLRILQQSAQQRVVEPVPGFVTAEFADQAATEQIQIADRIEDLVLDELVLVTQPVLVEHADIVQHDRILERATQRQVVRTQRLQIAHEAAGTSPADLFEERGGREIHRGTLQPAFEYRVIELDLEIDLEALERVKSRPLIAVLHAHALLDAYEALGRGLLLDAGGLQQEHKRSGAAIHDRHLGAVDLDQGIVDAQTREGREQMLDGRDASRAVDQRGT